MRGTQPVTELDINEGMASTRGERYRVGARVLFLDASEQVGP